MEHDHILMIPGKTDYLYSSAGVRMPAWRVTLSSEQKKLLSVFESARDVVSDELDVMEQSGPARQRRLSLQLIPLFEHPSRLDS